MMPMDAHARESHREQQHQHQHDDGPTTKPKRKNPQFSYGQLYLNLRLPSRPQAHLTTRQPRRRSAFVSLPLAPHSPWLVLMLVLLSGFTIAVTVTALAFVPPISKQHKYQHHQQQHGQLRVLRWDSKLNLYSNSKWQPSTTPNSNPKNTNPFNSVCNCNDWRLRSAMNGDDQQQKDNGRRRSSFRRNVKRLLTTRSIIGSNDNSSSSTTKSDDRSSNQKYQSMVDAAFAPVEDALNELETSLSSARLALKQAKEQSVKALEELSLSSEDSKNFRAALSSASESSSYGSSSDELSSVSVLSKDLSELTFEDIDYESSEMTPPFLDPNSCLMPDAEPVVRIEKAPENSRRIFAGIDILASADDVWNVLTNYAELQTVIPNLVVNDVLELYDGSVGGNIDGENDESLPEEVRCERLAKTMKGSLLRQVGGAKVAGIRFSATTTLEVREWPTGMPDFAHFLDDLWEGKSREIRAREYPSVKLKRYRFPRPFCVSDLPTRDISMQSTSDDDGEFRLYQGVWRMQPLVGCSPPGKQAMRLTYAVEISPRPYLPVRLVEGRIVLDLCSNLEAIRAAVTATSTTMD